MILKSDTPRPKGGASSGLGARLKLTLAIWSRMGFHRVFQTASRKQIGNLQNLSKLEKQAHHPNAKRNGCPSQTDACNLESHGLSQSFPDCEPAADWKFAKFVKT